MLPSFLDKKYEKKKISVKTSSVSKAKNDALVEELKDIKSLLIKVFQLLDKSKESNNRLLTAFLLKTCLKKIDDIIKTIR